MPVEAGIRSLEGGYRRRRRGWTQQWQTGWQPWAAELWDTIICCLQLPGWLHSLHGKYLLTIYHVEDTLLGTLRDKQQCDSLPLSGKEFLVWLEDSYQLAANTSYSTSLFAKHLQANHSPLNSLGWHPSSTLVTTCEVLLFLLFRQETVALKLSNLTWDRPFMLPEMPLLLLR